MARLGAYVLPSTVDPITVINVGFGRYSTSTAGFMLTHVWVQVDTLSSLVTTATSIINVYVSKGKGDAISDISLLADGKQIWRYPLAVGAGELSAVVALPEAILVDEDTLFVGAVFSSVTGSARVSFLLHGEVVTPTEEQRAILAFESAQ